MKIKLIFNQLLLFSLITILTISSGIYVNKLETDYYTKEVTSDLKAEMNLFATTILPPGSNETDLQNAINSAASGDAIVISSNITLTSSVYIPAGKEISIQSDEGNNWTLIQTSNQIRHFVTEGILNLQNITLDGSATGGGIQVDGNGGILNTYSGTIIQNCYGVDGGGVRIYGIYNMYGGSITNNASRAYGGGVYIAQYGGKFFMYDGNISNNNAAYGGGVYVYDEFTMYGGSIDNNTATVEGGGVQSRNGTTFSMQGGTITKNTAPRGGGIHSVDGTTIIKNGVITENTASFGGGIHIDRTQSTTISNSTFSNNSATNGGGIYIESNTQVNMNGTNYISNNTSTGDGGGIFVTDSATLNMTGSNYIINNTSGQNGGGIFIANLNYDNVNTTGQTTFSGNSAINPYAPPVNATTLYPNIGFASTTITKHPLNNYDINYTSGNILTFSITYNANGGTGEYVAPGVGPFDIDYVLTSDDTNIKYTGHTFTSWNTKPDGSGTRYMPGDDITLTDDVILYAMWDANIYTIEFDSNGGTSVPDQAVTFNDKVTEPNNPTKDGYVFKGWYTDNGTFQNKWDFNTPITEDITLYADWIEADYTVQFDSNGGTIVPDQAVTFNDKVTEPNNPTKDGYVFKGWYTDNGTFQNKWDFDTPVTEDITLYADWEEAPHTVQFETNGGSSVPDQAVTDNEKITKPSDPTKDGYVFEGWYTDNGTFQDKWDFDTPVTGDTTLYANWVKVAPTGLNNTLLLVCKYICIFAFIGIIVLTRKFKIHN